MPKHKKTRKEKIVADQRRQTLPVNISTPSNTNVPPVTSELLTTKESRKIPVAGDSPKYTPQISNAISTIDYRHLPGDLLKTALLTGSIVAIELVLKFIFHV